MICSRTSSKTVCTYHTCSTHYIWLPLGRVQSAKNSYHVRFLNNGFGNLQTHRFSNIIIFPRHRYNNDVFNTILIILSHLQISVRMVPSCSKTTSLNTTCRLCDYICTITKSIWFDNFFFSLYTFTINETMNFIFFFYDRFVLYFHNLHTYKLHMLNYMRCEELS
jgi:hypothetical protein